MMESPVIQRVIAETHHRSILDILKDRFGRVGRDVTRPLRKILDEKKLLKLLRLTIKCADLNEFREALQPGLDD